jgi:Na+/melibiose symporter-like transporter
MLTLPIYALGSIFFYLVAFRNLKEMKEIVAEEKRPLPIVDSFRALKANWPWLIIFSSSFLFWIGFIARINAISYFLQYSLHRKDLTWLAFSLDVVSLGTALGLPWFCKWTSKRNVWVIGLVGMVIGQLVMYLGVHNFSSQETTIYYWVGESITLPLIFFIGWTLCYLFSGMAMAMPFSVLSDSVDYGEWKNGVRAVGLLTAVGAAFCLKAGAGLGGAIPLWIMGHYGYVANAEQTPTLLRAIEFNLVWLPAMLFALAAVPVWFYKKYEAMEPQIHAELEVRRTAPAKEIAKTSV